eukprot:gene8706-10310_t
MDISNDVIGATAGLVAGASVIGMLEHVGHIIFGKPSGLDKAMCYQEACDIIRKHVKSSSTPSLLWILGAHGIGTAVGGYVAFQLSSSSILGRSTGVVASCFLVGSLANIAAIRHPTWWSICDILLYFPAAYGGASFVINKTPLL